MPKLIIFGILSLVIILISRRTLFNIRSHGFYRFFSWECMAWLLASNYQFWFVQPFTLLQITSWILLFYSAYLAIAGLVMIKQKGKPNPVRDEKNLFGFEKTTELIDTGVFKQIRHPLYAALIFLTWGIYLKNPTLSLFFIALISTNFLYFTSKLDEKECINYFGDKYRNYMKNTKMFIPFIF
ncbi:MAG: isoprenylcysteine carboxylmethyltransferase family protein [Bacteroidota bacterium]|nr:isoprenylcysteine carboxylmethyltransferase family protein [Bacteroidota bacterium]